MNVYDEVNHDGSITIVKQKADGSKEPLPGVTFKLVGVEDGSEVTGTTDQDGRIVWDDLIPQNYVITEIKTQDGYSLLKDEIEVTLPIEMTQDEITKNGADVILVAGIAIVAFGTMMMLKKRKTVKAEQPD